MSNEDHPSLGGELRVGPKTSRGSEDRLTFTEQDCLDAIGVPTYYSDFLGRRINVCPDLECDHFGCALALALIQGAQTAVTNIKTRHRLCELFDTGLGQAALDRLFLTGEELLEIIDARFRESLPS